MIDAEARRPEHQQADHEEEPARQRGRGPELGGEKREKRHGNADIVGRALLEAERAGHVAAHMLKQQRAADGGRHAGRQKSRRKRLPEAGLPRKVTCRAILVSAWPEPPPRGQARARAMDAFTLFWQEGPDADRFGVRRGRGGIGRRSGLKIRRPHGYVGSSPTARTILVCALPPANPRRGFDAVPSRSLSSRRMRAALATGFARRDAARGPFAGEGCARRRYRRPAA